MLSSRGEESSGLKGALTGRVPVALLLDEVLPEGRLVEPGRDDHTSSAEDGGEQAAHQAVNMEAARRR